MEEVEEVSFSYYLVSYLKKKKQKKTSSAARSSLRSFVRIHSTFNACQYEYACARVCVCTRTYIYNALVLISTA